MRTLLKRKTGLMLFRQFGRRGNVGVKVNVKMADAALVLRAPYSSKMSNLWDVALV